MRIIVRFSSILFYHLIIYFHAPYVFCQEFGDQPTYDTKLYLSYTLTDGLIHPQVTNLFIDQNRFLWIATKGGVSKFNGEKFQNFGIKEGLPNLRVNGFVQNQEGGVWISTRSGLAYYNGKTIKPFAYNDGLFTSKNICIDSLGNIWTPLKNELLCFNTNTGYYKATDEYPILCDLTITNIIFYQKHKAYILTQNQIIDWNIQQDKLEIVYNFEHKVVESEWINNKFPFVVLKYKLEIGDEVILWNNAHINNKFNPASSTSYDSLAQAHLPPLFRIADNSLQIFDNKNANWSVASENFPLLNAVAYEQNGSIWFGTENGIIHYFPKPFTYFPKHNLKAIWTMIEDTTKQLWLGSYEDRSLYKYINNNFVKTITFTDEIYTGGIINNKGNLLIPSEQLIEYNPYTERIVKKYPYKSLYVYYDKKRNQTVMGMQGGIGILKDNGAFSFIGPAENVHNNYFIICINEDKNGLYWFGSFTGLSSYNPQTNEVKNYTSENGKLAYGGVATIYKDVYNELWFGSDDGVLKYDETDDELFLLSDKILREQINAISGIDSTYIIIGTQNGIYFLDNLIYQSNNLIKLKLYNDHNGFIFRSVDQNGLFIDHNRDVWISSASIARLDYHKLDMKYELIMPLINSVNQKNISPHTTDTLILPYKTNKITIGFEGTGSERPITTLYSYRISEIQEDWSEWTTNNSLSFANLSSGYYTFELRVKQLHNTFPTDPIDRIVIQVNIPFYQEPNFYKKAFILFTILTALLGIISFVYLRSFYKNKHLRLVSSELDARSKYLEVKTLQEQLKPHFINNVLTAIQEKILHKDAQSAHQQLTDLAKLIRLYLESSIKSNPENSKDYMQGHSIAQELELLTKYIQFEQELSKDSFMVYWDIDESIDQNNHLISPMIIQPFVENAIKHGIKHSMATEKWIKFSMKKFENEKIVCTIEDNGIGRKGVEKMKQNSIKAYQSRATELVLKRVQNLARLKNPIHIVLNTFDIEPYGTKVEIIFYD